MKIKTNLNKFNKKSLTWYSYNGTTKLKEKNNNKENPGILLVLPIIPQYYRKLLVADVFF